MVKKSALASDKIVQIAAGPDGLYVLKADGSLWQRRWSESTGDCFWSEVDVPATRDEAIRENRRKAGFPLNYPISKQI